MICPKCRKKYAEGVDVCPDCGIDLIALLGEADAPEDEEPEIRKRRLFGSDKAPEYAAYEPESSKPVYPAVSVEAEPEAESEEEPVKEMPAPLTAEDIDAFSPVVYKTNSVKPEPVAEGSSRGAGIFFLIISILFMVASAVMFYLGRNADTQAAVPDAVSAVITLADIF